VDSEKERAVSLGIDLDLEVARGTTERDQPPSERARGRTEPVRDRPVARGEGNRVGSCHRSVDRFYVAGGTADILNESRRRV
jgi:hypothetical protein